MKIKTGKFLPSSGVDKAIVCGVSFVCASAAFVLAAVILVPMAGTFLHSMETAEWVQQVALLGVLLGPPIVAAFAGLGIGMKVIGSASGKT